MAPKTYKLGSASGLSDIGSATLALLSGKKPTKAATNLAKRIGTKEAVNYGTSQFPNLWNSNTGSFTPTGSATAGGLTSAGLAALNGAKPGQIAEAGGIGAGSGYLGSSLAEGMVERGMTPAMASGMGGSYAGGAGQLAYGALTDNWDETTIVPAATSTIAGSIAAGMGAGSWATPIGMAVGALVGFMMGRKNSGPHRIPGRFKTEGYEHYGGEITYDPETQRYVPGDIKYLGKIKNGDSLERFVNKKANYMADYLNNFVSNKNLTDNQKNALAIESSRAVTDLPLATKDAVRSYTKNLLGDFNPDNALKYADGIVERKKFNNQYIYPNTTDKYTRPGYDSSENPFEETHVFEEMKDKGKDILMEGIGDTFAQGKWARQWRADNGYETEQDKRLRELEEGKNYLLY